MRLLRPWLIALAVLAGALPARAGGISVMPTRVDFAPGRAVQSLLLTNLGADTVTVETHVRVWPEGAAQQQANDVVVTPGVVTLPPNQRVRVRVGLLRKLDDDREHAYRIYFTELPAPTPLQAAGIGVRLRIGIPVFVAPAEPKPERLRWAARPSPDGWLLEAMNPGNVHVRIAEATLLGGAAEAGGRRPDEPLQLQAPYVLANQTFAIARRGQPPAGLRIRWIEQGHEIESAVALP